MIYEGGVYRTTQLSILVSLIFIDIKDFQESGMKKGDISVALSSFAPSPGLEPVQIAIGTMINRLLT